MRAFPGGGFLASLYEPLDPSLVPSGTYALPHPFFNNGQPMSGIPSPSIRAPTIQQEDNVPTAYAPFLTHSFTTGTASPSSQLEPCVSESLGPGTFPPITNTVHEPAKVPDERPNTSQGQTRKRKGEDEVIAKPAKKVCSPCGSVTGKELGEGTVKSDEVNERARKPTLSGHVPLMPTRLAKAGYQQPTKKPKSKGNSTKPVSRGAAKTPGRKKVK